MILQATEPSRIPMSDGEIALTVLSVLTLLVAWIAWQYQTNAVGVRGMPTEGRRLLRIVPVVCLVLLWWVLRNLASYDVREDARYLFMYTVFGLAWVGIAVPFSAFAGVSMRDDVLERRNGAAAIVIAGAMLGLTLAFAGGNIGDGPGWWVVLFSALLSTLGLFLAWLLLDAFGHVSDSLTIDRDRASAVRLAGFLVAMAIILGRAVAGDWESVGATLRDFFVYAAPGALLLVIAIAVERALRPTAAHVTRAVPSHGAAPAAVYVLLALAWLTQVGFGN